MIVDLADSFAVLHVDGRGGEEDARRGPVLPGQHGQQVPAPRRFVHGCVFWGGCMLHFEMQTLTRKPLLHSNMQ